MILQIKTEKELLICIEKMQAEILELKKQNKELSKSKKPINSNDDILKVINKHVTIDFVNKLYKAGNNG